MKLVRLVSAAVIAAGALSLSPVVGTPNANAAGRQACDIRHDGGHYKRGAFTAAGVQLAQYRVYSFAPGYKRTVTREVSKVNSYQAGAKVGGSLMTTIGNKWISQAEVEVHADFSASGTWTTSSKTTVTDTVINTSRYNASFVFYRGSARRVTAPIYISVCRNDDGGSIYSGHIYWPRVGTLRSFSPPSGGALRCGAGTANVDAVGRKALAVGCA